MKNENRKQTTLNELFAKAKIEKPVMEIFEIKNLLNQNISPGKSFSKNNFFNLKNNLIMGTVISVISIALYFFIGNFSTGEKLIAKNEAIEIPKIQAQEKIIDEAKSDSKNKERNHQTTPIATDSNKNTNAPVPNNFAIKKDSSSFIESMQQKAKEENRKLMTEIELLKKESSKKIIAAYSMNKDGIYRCPVLSFDTVTNQMKIDWVEEGRIDKKEKSFKDSTKTKNSHRMAMITFDSTKNSVSLVEREVEDKDNDFIEESKRKIVMDGIKMLELSKEKLEELCVLVKEEGIEIWMSSETKILMAKSGTQVSTSSKKNSERKTQCIQPVLITDDLGKSWRVSSYDDKKLPKEIQDKMEELKNEKGNDKISKEIKLNLREYIDKKIREFILQKANTYLPILVRSGQTYTEEDRIKKRWRPDVILWFEPTEELFALLPKEKSVEISKEYQQIVTNQVSEIQGTKNLQKTTLSCNYFEFCKSFQGAITEYKISPNPTLENISISISLSEERKLKFSVVNISGQLLKELQAENIYAKGNQTYQFNISNFPAGIYLLVIDSDKGERVTQRIIKQ